MLARSCEISIAPATPLCMGFQIKGRDAGEKNRPRAQRKNNSNSEDS
jgi:hypothetical protein